MAADLDSVVPLRQLRHNILGDVNDESFDSLFVQYRNSAARIISAGTLWGRPIKDVTRFRYFPAPAEKSCSPLVICDRDFVSLDKIDYRPKGEGGAVTSYTHEISLDNVTVLETFSSARQRIMKIYPDTNGWPQAEGDIRLTVTSGVNFGDGGDGGDYPQINEAIELYVRARIERFDPIPTIRGVLGLPISRGTGRR